MQSTPLIKLGPGRPYHTYVHEADVPRCSLVITYVLVALSAAVTGAAIAAWILL